MLALSDEGRRVVDGLAAQHGVSADAVRTLLEAVAAGHGMQAQFNHPELGGMGQWSNGGMIMIGDMFNNALKYKVDALCTALSQQLSQGQLFVPPPAPAKGGAFSSGFGAGRWPAELGAPASSGSQNNMHYAIFPAARRLAVERSGAATVFDTGDHQLYGVSQQQSGDQSLTFNSQHGLVRLEDLAVVTADERPDASPPSAPAIAPSEPPAAREPHRTVAGASPDLDVFEKIERLADLRDRNILTDEEFAAKKAELLARL